jgi:hypothetical protein
VSVFVALFLALGLWSAVRSLPWAGPLAADVLRKIVGRDTVTLLEESWSGVKDRLHLARGRAEQPRSLEELKREPPGLPASPPVQSVAPPEPRFRPADVPAMNPAVAGNGDGAWRPIPDLCAPLRPQLSSRRCSTRT